MCCSASPANCPGSGSPGHGPKGSSGSPGCPPRCGGGAGATELPTAGGESGPRGPALRGFVRAEWGTVFPDVWRRLRTARLRAVPLTLASCVGILALQLVQHEDGLIAAVTDHGCSGDLLLRWRRRNKG